MVDVGGYKLFFKCSGQGSPTVILEAGNGADSTWWFKVMGGVEGTTRVCVYDRANLGSSDKGVSKPRTFRDMTRDLRALLVNAHIGGPYILVGHSMGGELVRVFADQHPAEVVGLVLVDSAHPDMGLRLLAGLPPESADESVSIKAWRQWFTWMSNSNGSPFQDLEGTDTQAGNEQVKATKPLGDLPLVVISQSPNNPLQDNPFQISEPPLPTETNAKLRQIWQDLQSELAGLSSNSTRVIATQAGHDIPREEPKLVVEAILKLVNEARSLRGETIPPALPASQTDAINHTPVILRVVERKENKNGQLLIYKDITFMDTAGDATTVVNKLISTTLEKKPDVSDDIILASSDEQKREASVTSTWVCATNVPPHSVVLEDRILDKASNLSEPVTVTFACP
jgi:pimeloyl-ACP methyl ester carboxylesterase